MPEQAPAAPETPAPVLAEAGGGALPAGFKVESTPPPPPETPETAPPQAPMEQPVTVLGHSDDQHKEDTAETEKEYPGFLQTVGSAATKKAIEATTNLMTGARVLLPEGVGGESLQSAYEQEKLHPKTKDKIDSLLEEPLSKGWSDWRWWTAQLAGSVGGVAPGLATAGAATMVGGPLAGIAGFGGEAAVERLLPAYSAARNAGLPHDAAVQQAIIDSGIAASFAVAMGLVGKFNISNAILQRTANETAAKLLSRPVSEAFLQLSVAQPGLMAGQDIATSLSHGEAPNGEQVATDMLLGWAAGYGIHRTFKGLDAIHDAVKGAPEEAAPASDAAIMQAAMAQKPKTITERARQIAQGTEPAAPVAPPAPGSESPLTQEALGGQYERELLTRSFISDTPSYFYSHLRDTVDEAFPDKMPAVDVVPWLKKRGVKDSELEAVGVKPYLADVSGHVSKKDLMAQIEMNQVEVQERRYALPDTDPMQEANDLYDHYAALFGTPNQSRWSPKARREMERARQTGEIARQEALKNAPQYTSQLIPGLRNRPEEYTFRSRVPEYAGIDIDKRAEQIWKEQNSGNVLKRNWASVPEESKREYKQAALEAMRKEDPRVLTEGHYPQDLNQFAHTRVSFERDRDGIKSMVVHEIQSDAHQAGARQGYVSEGGKVPDLPFKTNWQDLVIKRLMQMAADRGAERLVFANGDQVGFRLGTVDPETGRFSPSLSKNQVAGARQNYDKVLPGKAKHWGKQYGAENGYTRFDLPENMYENVPLPMQADRRSQHDQMGINQDRLKGDMFYLQITPAVASNIRMGAAFHNTPLKARTGRTLSDIVQENQMPQRLANTAAKLDKTMRSVLNELGVSRGVTINAVPSDNAWRGRVRDDFDPATGNYIIDVNTKRILTDHDLYAAMSHEIGHVVMDDMFRTAPFAEKASLFAAFREFRSKFDPMTAKVEDVRRLRDNAISLSTGARAMHDGVRLSDLDPGSKAYFLSFEEWFAEQTAKWMQTDERALSKADGFFKRLANKVRKMLAMFTKSHPDLASEPSQAFKDFMNDRWGKPEGTAEKIKEQFERDTVLKAKDAFDREGAPETTAVPEQASTGGGRDIIKNLGLGKDGGEAMAGHADRMNWFFDWFLSLPQVQELNPHLKQLALYTDMHRTANFEINTIMQAAHERVRQWGMIRDPKQLEGLTKFIDDYANGKFKLPHTEDGIFRRPNQEEFAALVKKHGLSDQSVRLFQGLVTDFDAFLEKYRTLLVNDARRVKDPNAQRVNIENINRTIDKLTQRPFIPLTRFGKYLVTVYDSKGNIRHSEQTNSLRRQRQIVDALKVHPDRLPGDIVLAGEVPKDATPFLGMPPGLIDLLAEKLSLSDTQKGVLDQLRFDYAPGHSFKHQFRELDLLPGYSTDFVRNYAHFFFHGARHITRVKWVDAMRDQMTSLSQYTERVARAGNPDGANRLDKIVKYMQRHFQAWVDPKSDWAGLRGMMFHWYLGFNPASAAQNLTQTPLMTYPYLGAAYGDFRAIKALTKASLDLNNFYKKGTLVAKGDASSDFMIKAMGELVKRGTISETQAHQLAALSEDRNLLRHFGKKGEDAWLKFQESSSWMFEMTEQYNRRLAARAALELAYNNPNHAEVKSAIETSPILYKELTSTAAHGGLGWTPQEAGAFLAAQRAVNKTQFEYAQYARPRIMRGPVGGTAFVFKLFTQNTLFNLISNPAMFARWMVVMGALGGLQGLAGFEDINSMIKTLAYRLFGKDFDLEDEARHVARNWINETWAPDVLMQGIASKGFGIPAVMHSMGMNWAPTIDMSKSVGFGNVLGFDPFKPLGPTKHPKEETLRQASKAVGAAFGLPISIYDFATSNDNFTDLKKYEAIAPRFLGNLSHAFRWGTEGKEVNQAGNAVVKFDTADTEQMMEILARAGGFQPRRLTEEYTRIAAQSEAATFWDLRRAGLLRQFAEAVKSNDSESKDKVLEAIRKYNDTLPEWAKTKAITGQQIKSSIQQRLRVQQQQEEGLPAAKSNIPISQEVEKYYPRGWPPGLQSAKPVQ